MTKPKVLMMYFSYFMNNSTTWGKLLSTQVLKGGKAHFSIKACPHTQGGIFKACDDL